MQNVDGKWNATFQKQAIRRLIVIVAPCPPPAEPSIFPPLHTQNACGCSRAIFHFAMHAKRSLVQFCMKPPRFKL